MKKLLPYILILAVLVGSFGPILGTKTTHAQSNPPSGHCSIPTIIDPAACSTAGGTWTSSSSGDTSDKSPFEQLVDSHTCGFTSVGGCAVQVSYFLFYTIPAFVLWLAAYVFNFLISISLSSSLLTDPFVYRAWGVVRDLSNIFFILILLYVAFELVLGLGGAGAKKTIARVIIIALLINFSMFFTNIIIDSSNILALIFYNKLDPNITSNGQPRSYTAMSGEKDAAGVLVGAFNPANALSPTTINQAEQVYVNNDLVKTEKDVSTPILIGLIIFSGSLMYYAAIVLFVAGFAFLIRILWLWVLIIFSPFAFVSFAAPFLQKIEYIGWGAWFKRLIKTAFMAPIFMFFLYFIFMLVQANPLGNLLGANTQSFNDAAGLIRMLLSIALPLILVEALLFVAVKFAIKSSGKVAEIAMSIGKAAGALGLAAVTSGASLAATGTLGALASKAASSQGLKNATKAEGIKGYTARMALRAADYGSKASFDVRNTALGKQFSKSTGMNIQSPVLSTFKAKTGGYKGAQAKRAEEFSKQAELMKTTMNDEQVRAWSNANLYKYQQEKNRAKIAQGNKWNEEEYDRTHPAPKSYNSKDELDKETLESFVKKMGRTSLLGTAAYHVLRSGGGLVEAEEKTRDEFGQERDNYKYYKKADEYMQWEKMRERAREEAQRARGEGYKFNKEEAKEFEQMFNAANPEPTVQSINDKRITKAKVVIGGTAAAGLGVITGGAAAGAAGMVGAATVGGGTVVGGATMGGVAGLAAAAGYAGVEKGGEAKFTKDTSKQLAQLQKVNDRIAENTAALGSLNKMLEGFVDKDIDGKSVDKEKGERGLASRDDKGNIQINIDQMSKVEERITSLGVTAKRQEAELRRLVEQGGTNEQKDQAERDLRDTNLEIDRFNKLKTADKDRRALQKQIFDFGQTKSRIEKEQQESHKPKEGTKEGHGATKASKPATPEHQEEPAAHAPTNNPPSPGDHGHQAA